MTQEGGPGVETGDEEDVPVAAAPEMPLAIVIGRILIVTGMGFSAAGAIFFLVGGLWLPALAALGATTLFLFLMFAIERAAER